jgi:hypothetical protein
MDEVDLEADVELDLVWVVPWDGTYADEVEERNTTLAVVHEICLTFFPRGQAFLEVGDRRVVGKCPIRTLFHLAIRGLEETTYRLGLSRINPDNFVRRCSPVSSNDLLT